MSEFVFDGDKALITMAAISGHLDKIVKGAERAELAAQKMAPGFHKASQEIAKSLEFLEKNLATTSASQESLGAIFKQSSFIMRGALTGIATESFKASTKLSAMQGQMEDLNQVLVQTARDTTLVNTLIKLANSSTELTAKLKLTEDQLRLVQTEEAKRLATVKEQIASANRLHAAETRQANLIKETQKSLELLNTEQGKELSQSQARLAALKKEQQSYTTLQSSLIQLQGKYGEELKALQQQVDLQQVANKGRQEAVTFNQRLENSLEELKRSFAALNTDVGKQQVILKGLEDAKKQDISFSQRQAAALSEHRRKLADLDGGYEAQIAQVKVAASAKQRETTETQRQIAKLQELERQLDSLNGGYAEKIARTREAVNARNAEIRAEEKAKRSSEDLTQQNKQEAESVRRLTKEEKALEKLRETSVLQILRGSDATKASIKQLSLANQTGAMMRATMAGLHSSIGMYTSSTILAASATYAIASALRSAVESGTEFEYVMARVEAITTGGMSREVAGGMTSAMSEYVRAVAMINPYTAPEAAEGLNELAMAGLSANDSMIALEGTLNMATIGQVSMGQAADYATNILAAFNKEAGELNGVVDQLAVAITSSNTNFTQLASAISYVGPAAEAAGYSLEETIAAVEVLANVGIKGTRAGTGLRRIMVNLQTPTTKGAKVLQEYGIAVDDASGSSRTLTDVMGQLHDALSAGGITEAEKMAAAVDLVGVRASQTFLALMKESGSGGALSSFAMALEHAEGAADRMKDTLQDTLKIDWKTTQSMFTDAQLTLMESMGPVLKEMNTRASTFLATLSEPASMPEPFGVLDWADTVWGVFSGTTELFGQSSEALDEWSASLDTALSSSEPLVGAFGEGVTELDVWIAKLERATEAVVPLAKGFLAFSFLKGNVFNAASNELDTWAKRLDTVRKKQELSRVATTAATAQTSAQTAAVNANTEAYLRNAGAIERTNGALSKTAGKASKLAAGLGVASRLTGWGFLLWGIADALSAVYSKTLEERIDGQAARTERLNAQYEKQKEVLEKIAAIRKRDATRELKTNTEDRIAEAQRTIESLQGSLADASAVGNKEAQDYFSSQIKAKNHAVKEYSKSLEELKAQLDNPVFTKQESDKAADSYTEVLQVQVKLQRELNQLEGVKDGTLGLRNKYEQMAVALQVITDKLASLKKARDEAAEGSSWDATLSELEEERDKLLALEQVKGASLDVRLSNSRELRDEALAEAERASGKVKRNDSGASRSNAIRAFEAYNKQFVETWKLEQEYAKEVKKSDKEIAEQREALLQQRLSDSELLARLQGQLDTVASSNQSYTAAEAEGTAHTLEQRSEYLQSLQREHQLRGQIASLTNKESKDDSAKQLEKYLSQFEKWQAAYAPLVAAQKEFSQGLTALNALLSAGKISPDQYRKAVDHLRDSLKETAIAQDTLAESAQSLREAYLDSPFTQYVEDLTLLNELYEKGKVSASEFAQIQARIKSENSTDYRRDGPKVNYQLADMGAAQPTFDAYMANAEGMGEFNRMESSLTSAYGAYQASAAGSLSSSLSAIDTGESAALDSATSEYDRNQIAMEAEMEREVARVEHLERLKAAEEKYNSDMDKLADARTAYQADSAELAKMAVMSSSQQFLGMFASMSEEATGLQKAAWIAQKAIAVAQIIMSTNVAAAKARELNPMDSATPAVIMGLGYAQAGLVAAMAISEASGGGGGDYAGAYDNGGFIPQGKKGVVGEYGAEIVSGPAYITSRGRSASKLQQGGDTYQITLAPQITVENSNSSDNGSTAQEDGKAVGQAVKTVVLSTLQEQIRPNGLLDTWLRSKRGS